MKVLCLIENLGSGGAERQLTGLAVMLKQHGYEVEVCYYIKKEFYKPFLNENGVKSHYLFEAANPRRRFSALKRHIKEFAPDTVLSYSESTSMIACMLKKLGVRFNLIVSERNTTQSINFREKVKFFLYRSANHIVPNSHSQGDFMAKYFNKISNKVKVITNFVDTDKFSPIVDFNSNDHTTRMICVGRLMPQKNVPRFIGAISKVIRDGYSMQVDWFGQDLQDDYSAECYNAIEQHNLKGIFIFHAPSSAIQNEYRQADVFCLPSLYEGFPNVLCEAMSCGKPVICSRVCDNPIIIREGSNGLLFDPKDANDMASVIESFLSIPIEKRNMMGDCSREIALATFSQESFIKKYLEIIEV